MGTWSEGNGLDIKVSEKWDRRNNLEGIVLNSYIVLEISRNTLLVLGHLLINSVLNWPRMTRVISDTEADGYFQVKGI